MIDPFNLSQLRRVDLLADQEGTKVASIVQQGEADFDLLEPVRSAIGTNLAASLMLNDFNILVEGAADKPILDAAFRLFQAEAAAKMLINGSISESKDCILARFYARTKLPFIILLDADSGGRDLKAALVKWQIPDANILMLGDVIPREGKDFAIEDILSETYYFEAVLKAYPSNPIEKPANGNKKRVNQYEEAFKSKYGIGFSKKRVAETIGKLLLQDSLDEETKENLKKLTDTLLERLNALLQAQNDSLAQGQTKA